MPLCTHCLSKEAETTRTTVGSLCTYCFCDLIERRVKKEVRQHYPFRPNETVLVVNDNSPQACVTLALLPKIIGGLPLHIDEWNGSAQDIPDSLRKSHTKILIPKDGDDIAVQFLEWLMKHQDHPNNTLSIVSCLTHCEVEAYAAAKHIPSIPRAPSDMHTSLQDIEKNYPGLTHGLLKGATIFQLANEEGIILTETKKTTFGKPCYSFNTHYPSNPYSTSIEPSR